MERMKRRYKESNKTEIKKNRRDHCMKEAIKGSEKKGK
jgi:hypothetical protein